MIFLQGLRRYKSPFKTELKAGVKCSKLEMYKTELQPLHYKIQHCYQICRFQLNVELVLEDNDAL